MRALTLLLIASPAFAYESVCFQYADNSKETTQLDAASRVTCTPAAGPNTARHRWVGPLDEHRLLFERAREAAGLPAAVSATFALDTFTSDATVAIGAAQSGTLIPTPFALSKRQRTRHLSVAELSQLPDYSYSLWDWATGHETCPLTGGGDPTVCHDFTTHMGPVNSNHFLPQAQNFYVEYHQLALSRADACLAMQTKLGADAPRFSAFLKQCELEAIALEAVGQHYLQDAWSTGHMWARWGSPELSDFPGAADEPRDRAVLVALVTGLIHGSRGVLQKLPGWTSYDVNDALCSPQASVQYVHEGVLHHGLGDDYLPQLPATLGDTGMFGHQVTQLMSCAVSGLSEVYQRAGQQHGAPGARAMGLRSVMVNSEACFGQRATNLALSEAAALQLKVAGQQVVLPLDSRFVGWMVPKVARQQGEVAVPPKLRNEFRFSMMRSMTKLRLLAKEFPEGTQAANGAMGALVGVEPNTAFAARTPIATYLEPALPWPGPADRPTEEKSRAFALAGLFHRAHAADWCAQTDAAGLEAIRVHTADATLDAEGKLAACAACVEISSRHLRLGTPVAYDLTKEPLCKLLDANAPVVYQLGADVTAGAKAYCGCP
jgi:hypothetical protein